MHNFHITSCDSLLPLILSFIFRINTVICLDLQPFAKKLRKVWATDSKKQIKPSLQTALLNQRL